MPKKKVKKMVKAEKEKKDEKDDSKLFAFLAAFLSIIGFIIALVAKREDKYVMYYAKQSLVVFIAGAILGAAAWIFVWIPVLGGIIKGACNIIVLVLWIISWVYALSGKEKEVPIVGRYAEKINL